MDAFMYQLLAALLAGIIIGMIIILQFSRKYRAGEEQMDDPAGENHPDWNVVALLDEIQKLPSKVLHTIQGSISPKKGKVGELIFYTRLLSEYDRLIPLGQPIDFIGIKNRRSIDLIEVKTGNSQLSKEEAEIRRLVEEGKVKFVLQRIDQDVYQQRKLDGI